MPKFSNARKFHIGAGFRAPIRVPNPHWLIGTPFNIPVTILNASAMSTDLSLRGTWSGERRVAAAYAVASSSDTARLNAVLALDAVSLRIVPFSDASAGLWTNAQKLLASGTTPYLSGVVSGVPFRQSLVNCISHFIKRFESDQGTAADEITGTLDQHPIKLDMPIRVNLMQDALSLVSDAAVALGADVAAYLQLYGTMVPADQWTSFSSGAACGSDGDEDDQEADVAAVLGTRQQQLAPTVVNPFAG